MNYLFKILLKLSIVNSTNNYTTNGNINTDKEHVIKVKKKFNWFIKKDI